MGGSGRTSPPASLRSVALRPMRGPGGTPNTKEPQTSHGTRNISIGSQTSAQQVVQTNTHTEKYAYTHLTFWYVYIYIYTNIHMINTYIHIRRQTDTLRQGPTSKMPWSKHHGHCSSMAPRRTSPRALKSGVGTGFLEASPLRPSRLPHSEDPPGPWKEPRRTQSLERRLSSGEPRQGTLFSVKS